MKIVFVGGGAHRYLGVARSVLGHPNLLPKGELVLYDLQRERAEIMQKVLCQSPEARTSAWQVSVSDKLEEALNGADVVTTVFRIGDVKRYEMGRVLAGRYGFYGSDQLSPTGALLALRNGKVVMEITRMMERLCPEAWLLQFANPVASISAAVNNHTRIRCLGVCGGFTNHLWDLNRVLGIDSRDERFEIHCAGVNHLSWIGRDARCDGESLYVQIEAALSEQKWRMPPLLDCWGDRGSENIRHSLKRFIEVYHRYGWLVFSTEGDGLAHVLMEEYYRPTAREWGAKSESMIDAEIKLVCERRQEAAIRFHKYATEGASPELWDNELCRADWNIMSRCICSLSGLQDKMLATSTPNRGAVPGFPDRVVLEYSHRLGPNGVQPASGLAVPDVFYGLTADLAMHQTLTGDAIATEDPRLLYEALICYPVDRDCINAHRFYRELIKWHQDEISAPFQKAIDYFHA